MDYEYAKEKDIKELYDLQLRAFESEAEMINSRNVPALMESYEENRADFSNWTVLIKRDDSGKIIGAVRCRENGDHIEIGRLMVAQEHRNRGIATDLMTAVEELTQAKAFELYTCTKSYININLYEKLGYWRSLGMSDVHSPTTRSYNMSMIKGKDTKPEVAVRKYLFSQGFRYRKNVRKMPGSPDIVLPKYKTCIFVNGCFWHKHEGCRYFVWPKSNEEFWKNKIETNVERDNRNYNTLKENGWNVIVIWECEIKNNYEDTMKNVISLIKSNQLSLGQEA